MKRSKVLTPKTLDPDPAILRSNRARAAIRHVLEQIPADCVVRLYETLERRLPVLLDGSVVRRALPRRPLTADRRGSAVGFFYVRPSDQAAATYGRTVYGEPLVEALPAELAGGVYAALGATTSPEADQAVAEASLLAAYERLGVKIDRGARFVGLAYRQALVEISREALGFEVASLRLDLLRVVEMFALGWDETPGKGRA